MEIEHTDGTGNCSETGSKPEVVNTTMVSSLAEVIKAIKSTLILQKMSTKHLKIWIVLLRGGLAVKIETQVWAHRVHPVVFFTIMALYVFYLV